MNVKRAGRRYGDAAIAIALAVGITLELIAWDKGPELRSSVPAGLLATLPLALRRRSPLVGFLLAMAGLGLITRVAPGFDNDSMSFVLVFFLALYSLGRHARGYEAWLGGIGVIVEMAIFAEGEGGIGQADLGDIAFLVVFVGAPWAAGLTVRLRREREEVLTAEKEALRAAQEENTRRAVVSERATIARELHDVVSHAISVTVLQARGARRMLGTDEAAVREALDAIEHTNTQALGDMRRLLSVLRDTEDDAETAPQPSLKRLDSLLDDVRRSGLAVALDEIGAQRDVPPGVDLSAYRIVQEALTNVLRHAGPARAVVTLAYGEDALRVTVTDDGQGRQLHIPNGEYGGGHGLIGIRERVAVVGGEISAGPAKDGGFKIEARLPYSLEVS